jgi:hypothetical protein
MQFLGNCLYTSEVGRVLVSITLTNKRCRWLISFVKSLIWRLAQAPLSTDFRSPPDLPAGKYTAVTWSVTYVGRDAKTFFYYINLLAEVPDLRSSFSWHNINLNRSFIVSHSFIHSFINGSISPLLAPGHFFQFRNLFYTVGRTPWTSDQPVTRPLPTHRTTQTE